MSFPFSLLTVAGTYQFNQLIKNLYSLWKSLKHFVSKKFTYSRF